MQQQQQQKSAALLSWTIVSGAVSQTVDLLTLGEFKIRICLSLVGVFCDELMLG